MFFDNNELYRYLYRLRRAGIEVPVVAGIMPVTNGKQIQRIMSLSGSKLPARFRAIIDRFGDNPAAMQQAGVAYATEQIIDLLANGAEKVIDIRKNFQAPLTKESYLALLEDLKK